MIPLASVSLFKRQLKRAETLAGCRCEIDRSSNMSSDLRISQIPAIVHCQLSVCSSQQRAKIDVRTYEEKITRSTLLGETGHLPPLFPSVNSAVYDFNINESGCLENASPL